jgi:hypothetical protein
MRGRQEDSRVEDVADRDGVQLGLGVREEGRPGSSRVEDVGDEEAEGGERGQDLSLASEALGHSGSKSMNGLLRDEGRGRDGSPNKSPNSLLPQRKMKHKSVLLRHRRWQAPRLTSVRFQPVLERRRLKTTSDAVEMHVRDK